jgi:hypothetical protein
MKGPHAAALGTLQPIPARSHPPSRAVRPATLLLLLLLDQATNLNRRASRHPLGAEPQRCRGKPRLQRGIESWQGLVQLVMAQHAFLHIASDKSSPSNPHPS